MNIQGALVKVKDGYKIKRVDWADYVVCRNDMLVWKRDGDKCNLNMFDIAANDWECKEDKHLLPQEKAVKFIEDAYDVEEGVSYDPIIVDLIKRIEALEAKNDN